MFKSPKYKEECENLAEFAHYCGRLDLRETLHQQALALQSTKARQEDPGNPLLRRVRTSATVIYVEQKQQHDDDLKYAHLQAKGNGCSPDERNWLLAQTRERFLSSRDDLELSSSYGNTQGARELMSYYQSKIGQFESGDFAMQTGVSKMFDRSADEV